MDFQDIKGIRKEQETILDYRRVSIAGHNIDSETQINLA